MPVTTSIEEWKEGNVLFNDALNTFYLRLYGVGHMEKGHSGSERGNPLPSHGLLFLISSKGSFYMHHHTNRITHTTAFVAVFFALCVGSKEYVICETILMEMD